MKGRFLGKRGPLGALAVVLVAICGWPAVGDGRAPRPDLIETSVSAPAIVAQGSPFTVADRIKNRGRAKARASTTAFYVSLDTRRNAADVRIGSRRVRALRPRRKSRGATSVTVPGSVAPGAYFVIACADARRAVRESKERNNCRPSALKTSVTAPGGGPSGGPGSGTGPLDHLVLSPSGATIDPPPLSAANADYAPTRPTSQAFTAEGFDAQGHDLGDVTAATTFTISPDGSCAGNSCSVTAAGQHTVTGTDGAAAGSVALTGGTPNMTCRGENYDVDGSDGNGCEQAQPSPGHTTQATAIARSNTTCTDSDSQEMVGGSILSDARVHQNPTVPGFDSTTGSAPEWISRLSSGGVTCVNDYSMTFATSGGGPGLCYRATIMTDQTTASVTVSGSGMASTSGGSGSYTDGTTIFFKIEKLCATNVREAVSYSLSYHL